jgi:bifunctional DNA-binding transcriptional regulator/antitoxin component of YhaV-PrlF toxin-antitoxin module
VETLSYQLQEVSTHIGKNEYTKYQVVIPKKLVEKLGWHKKDQIIFNSDDRNNRLILSKSKILPEPKKPRLNYEEFRQTIFWQLLSCGPSTYNEMTSRNPKLPKSPSPMWVKRMKQEYPAFKREKDRNPKSTHYLSMVWSYGGK